MWTIDMDWLEIPCLDSSGERGDS